MSSTISETSSSFTAHVENKQHTSYKINTAPFISLANETARITLPIFTFFLSLYSVLTQPRAFLVGIIAGKCRNQVYDVTKEISLFWNNQSPIFKATAKIAALATVVLFPLVALAAATKSISFFNGLILFGRG